MATKGLSFENPLYQDSGGVPSAIVNPFGFQNAASASGSDALRDDLSSLAVMGDKGVMAARQNRFTMPEMKQPPSIGYSPSRKEFFVQGTTFSSDDAQSLVQAEGLLGGPSTGLPTEGDWMPLDQQSYGQLVQNVRNPSLGTLAARNFGRGVDSMQMLAGRGLQLAGAEQLGGRIVGQQMEDLRRTTPYERQFTDIESGRGAVEWLVANFAQQGPNMIESIATAGLGYLAGTAATGTPIGGAAAAFSSLLGKSAWKESVKAALSKQVKGEALNLAEQKLLREAAGIGGAVAASYEQKLLRAGIGGAVAASYGQNLATGAADIYGELREQGAGAEDTNARLTALAGSVPYALLETLPEFLLAGRVFKGVGAPAPMGVGVSASRRGLELLKRGATGFAIGGTAEGTTELGQEALLLALSDQDFGSPENVNRLINSFAAGFGVGGPIGAVANLRGRQPANLLNAAQNPDPAPAPTGGALAPYYTPVTPIYTPGTPRGGPAALALPAPGMGATPYPSAIPMGGAPGPGAGVAPYYTPVTPMGGAPGAAAPQLGATPGAPLGLPSPGPVIAPMGGPVIMAGMGPGAVAYRDQMLRQQGNVPPGGPGTQGVLDVFGGQISAQELATRMQPQQTLLGLPAPAQAPVVNPAQGALQFAGPAPTAPANTQMQNQMQAIQDRIRRQREFDAVQAQQAAVIQQQTEALAQQSANARDLYAMQQGQTPFPSLPMRQTGPTQPVQLPLFTRRQAPVPPKAGQLRRGGRMQPTPAQAQPAARGTQLPLITQEGQPSLAALKSAGRKETVKPAPAAPKAPVTKPRTQRGLKKQAGVAAVEVKEKPNTAVSTTRGEIEIVKTSLLDDVAQRNKADTSTKEYTALKASIAKNGVVNPITIVVNSMGKPEVFEGNHRLQAARELGIAEVPVVLHSLANRSESIPVTGIKPSTYLTKEKPSATQKGKLKQGSVAKRQQDNAGAQGGGDVGDKPATEVKAGGAKAGGRGIALKRGAGETERKARTDALVKKGQLVQAGRQWSTYADSKTQPKWAELSPAQQEAWRKVAIEDGKPTMTKAEEIAPPKKAVAAIAAAPAVTETPAETWDAMDTGVEWTALPPGQQTRWTESDRAQNTADTIAEDVRNPQTPEALWEDMKPEGAPEYGDLPAPVRAQWRQDADAGKATIQRAEEILGGMEETPLQLVNSEFAAAEGATDIRDFRDAISIVVEFAYFTNEETNTKAAVLRARELLAKTSFTAEQQNAIDAALLELVNTLPSVEAVYTRGTAKGDSKPWFDYAVQRGLLPQITTVVKGLSVDAATKMLDSGQLRVANLPADTVKKYKASVGPVSGIIGKAGANLKNDTRSNAATTLSDYIKELNTKTVPLNKTQRENATKKLRDLWAAVRAAGMEEFADQNGITLADYFDANGNPYTGSIKGIFRVATEEITDGVQAERERAIAEDDEDSIAVDADYKAPYTLEDFNIGIIRKNTLRYFRDDGTPINNPIPIGRVKMLVSAFLSKLGIKPKVQVYRNQADFKAKNPQLYAQAVASRPQGDFDTANAVGYSFGDGNVIIFADRVVTEQQLKFVLAHETLGHFGFRGLLTERELNAALDGVYNSSAKVKAAVDTAMQARKMSRQEATEEYLADFAGMLDTNVLARFWNAIKNALNKLGVRFDDDMARYLVSQSRRYVRNGTTSGTFMDFKAMAQRMSAIEGITDPDGSGRFALAAEYYDEINRNAAANASGQRSTKLFDITSLFQQAKDRGTNIGDYVNRLIGELKSMNYAARENQGYRRLYDIFRDTSKSAAQLRAQYNKMMDTVLSPAVEVLGRGFTQGASEAQIASTSAMLNVTSRVKLGDLTEAELRKLGSLINIEGGEARLNQEVYDILAARGKFTIEDFKKGIKYTISVPRPMTEERRVAIRAERDAELRSATTDKERKAIEREYQRRLDAPSMLVDVEQSFPAMPDLTDKSLEWIMYNEVRDTMNKSAIDMLLANFAAAKGERDNVERVVQRFLDRALTENDKSFLKQIEDKYLSLRAEGSAIDISGVVVTKRESVAAANDFIKKFNAAVLGRDTDRNADVQAFFDSKEMDDVAAGIEALKKDSNIPRSGPDRFVMQQAIQNLALFELSKIDAELLAKRSIAGGYVPFGREGSWQVRIQAVDPRTGRIYKVSEQYRQQLLFSQVENRAEAEAMAERIQGMFDDVKDGFEMEVLDGTEFVIKKVKLVAQSETARETVSTTAEANLNEIISAITRFSISITPEERERLIVGLTQQNAKARTRLKRAGTPGEDPNTIKYVSQHLESTASTVARKQNRHRLDRLFNDADPDSVRLWFGDKGEYDKRKAAWEAAEKDPTMSEPKKFAAKMEFVDYHYTFVTKESPVMGNRFKDRGRRAVAFMESQSNVDYTDFASGEAASAIRMATTFAFMGASFATAILNYMALATNVLPSFAGYNDKNNFGGGFGWGMSSVEISRAIGSTKGFGQSEIKFWDDMLADPAKLKASGFTEAEARFMQKEVGGGTMQAALTNSLLGSARGKFRSGATKAAAETWMSLFNYTEQHSRRATGLAAFRMSYARALAEGKDAATAFEVADKFAVDMIDNTLGEYAMYNRPAMFRGDVRQFVFMFKMFSVNSIQMLAALPRKEQLLALGILAMFAGLKGLPFAEDLMDIIDTIAQGLGLGPNKLWKGSAEKTLAEALDAIAPGMTPILMRGLLNTITPANVADRVSMSNVLPGTGIALAGADVGRELIEIAGPVASFLQGALATSADAAKWGLGTVGVLDDTTSFNKVLRESPVVMFRALGDMMAYNNAGAIVSQKGYVVSNDLHLGTMLTRALGFYPAAAVAENDVVRLSMRIGDYQKDVVAMYRGLYVGAKIAKDNDRAGEVVQMVKDWNDAAKGTGLEIRNFEGSANRALREAQRTATERYLKAAPKAMRPETQRILNLYGVTEE